MDAALEKYYKVLEERKRHSPFTVESRGGESLGLYLQKKKERQKNG